MVQTDTPLDWKDTNVGLIGSQADKDMRKFCANHEPAWTAIDPEAVGRWVWRIEQFHVCTVPQEEYGRFYKGDTYIILVAKLDPENPKSEKLLRDIHFLIGPDSTADEYGTAAYKTVELDDFFDGDPIQHREEMFKESAEFKAIFPEGLQYLEGGEPTGFRHVVPEGHETKMFQVRKHKGITTVVRIPLVTLSLNNSDSFILDCPEKIYVFDGASAHPSEKFEANKTAEKREAARYGRVETTHDIDDGFWKHLEGDIPAFWYETLAPQVVGALNKPSSSLEGEQSDDKRRSDGYYDLQDLQHAGETPAGVKPEEKEQYLDDQTFQCVFGMDKDGFRKLPKWRQILLKKQHSLY